MLQKQAPKAIVPLQPLPKLLKSPSLHPLNTMPQQFPPRKGCRRQRLNRVGRLLRLRSQRPMLRLVSRTQPRVLRPIRARTRASTSRPRLLRKLRLRHRPMRNSSKGLMRPVRRGQQLEPRLQQRPLAQSRRQPRRRSHKLRHLERRLRPKPGNSRKKLQRPKHS